MGKHLSSREEAKEEDCKNDNHRPHRVTPVLLELWMPPIGHGNGVDGVAVGKIQIRVT